MGKGCISSSLLLGALCLCLLLPRLSVAELTVIVKCESTAGPWTVEVHPSWSPNGAKRYLDLVQDSFYDNVPLFRAVSGFLVQFGISLDKDKNHKWEANIQDDPYPIQVDMKKGIMAFAGYGKHSRSTQIWIGYDGAAGLGKSPWETPFAEVIEGMQNVDKIYSGYGDQADQGKLHTAGESYVAINFPKMDFIRKCFIAKEASSLEM